jgi:hypothetical protein
MCRPLLCLQGPLGPFQSVWPVAQQEVTESHQPFCVGAWLEALTTLGMPERRLGETGVEKSQTKPAMLLKGAGRRAKQSQVTLAPPTRVGPPLAGAAGRATHVIPRLNWHRTRSRVPE